MTQQSQAAQMPAAAHTSPILSSNALRKRTSVKRSDNHGDTGSTQVAHTLTACTRCRQRKTRCDPGLPRCTPCERTNSVCEYFDSNKGHNVNRNYVVYLQHKVREVEAELTRVENEDNVDDPEAMMRAATVRMHEAKESKFLGPSSGIAITRLVMQLAKQFTGHTSIKDIVPEQQAKQIKELYHQEQAKPTSKVYPLISDVAAVDLPNRALTDVLVQLYKLKVQPMYPALHEPTLDKDVEAVYVLGDEATPYQQFVCRMVIAISLQKMDTQYAGLADSFYLAALKHLEPVVRPMDLKTLQCFALMAEYSLLTPTRTAIYYIVGIAVRLAQALGLNEEKTIVRGRADGKVDLLEIDMRRRLFWCIVVMDYGLSHSLGRPAILATGQDHIDVGWFDTCDDKYITPAGIDQNAQRPTLKKWVAIHFFKMRMLQLEIRRKLYLKKRNRPKNDQDPWFIQMDAKLCAWRDAAPSQDEGFGMNKVWFIGRYNTMVVFLYRPCPQVPRPSLDAALKCFDACEYNIYMHREQIARKTVDLTWIFTQAIFMCINTMLWSLSYDEVRRRHNRESVKKHLDVAMEAIQLASERWPGVASAVQLYQKLICAIMKIYDRNGDVPLTAASPSEVVSPGLSLNYSESYNRSRTTSPATVSSSSVATPPERPAPFGQSQLTARRGPEQPPAVSSLNEVRSPSSVAPVPLTSVYSASNTSTTANLPSYGLEPSSHQPNFSQPLYVDSLHQYNALPEFTAGLTIPNWSVPQSSQMQFPSDHLSHHSTGPQDQHNVFDTPLFDPTNPSYGLSESQFGLNGSVMDAFGAPPQDQSWDMDAGAFGTGLNQTQQEELMQSLETDGMEDIQSIISNTLAAITPKVQQQPRF